MVGDDGRGMVWPSDVPDEVAATMGIKKEKPTEAAPAPKEKKKRASKKKEKLPENVVSLKDRAQPPAGAEVSQAPIEAGVAEQLSPQPSPPPSPKKKKAAAQNPKTKRELPSYLRVVK